MDDNEPSQSVAATTTIYLDGTQFKELVARVSKQFLETLTEALKNADG